MPNSDTAALVLDPDPDHESDRQFPIRLDSVVVRR